MSATATTKNATTAAAAAVAAPSTSIAKIEKRSLLSYVGNRVKLTLDDRSVLTGRLVSLGLTGNVILTDVERERLLKRQRNSKAGVFKTTRECYATVLFVRGSSITSIGYDSGITTDKGVVDCIGGTEEQSSRVVQLANMSPSAR